MNYLGVPAGSKSYFKKNITTAVRLSAKVLATLWAAATILHAQ